MWHQRIFRVFSASSQVAALLPVVVGPDLHDELLQAFDTLLPQVQREIDPAARQAMLDEIAAIVQDETAYVPLHVQPLLWGSKSSVSLVQRPDNFFLLRWVTIAE